MSKAGQKNPETKGVILKQAREAQGISLDAVHGMTKIPMDVLKAIEEGYTIKTLSSFYFKGFLKMYAQYLGVDVNKVVEDYRPEQLPARIPKGIQAPELAEHVKNFLTERRQKQIFIGVAVVFVLFAVTKIGGCIGRHMMKPRAVKVATKGAEKPIPLVKAKTVSPKGAKVNAVASVEKKKTPPPPKETEVVEEEGEDALPASREESQEMAAPLAPAAEVPAGKKVRLTIRAKKSGWLQVKVDGNLVFQSTMKEGFAETWQADKMIEVSGKNIHNLEFEVNGKTVGGLGRADRSARRVVITPEGLSVKE